MFRLDSLNFRAVVRYYDQKGWSEQFHISLGCVYCFATFHIPP